MTKLALATSIVDLPNDDDMPLLVDACRSLDVATEVCAWDDLNVDWSRYDHVILRSTWNYVDRRREFLDWCEQVSMVSRLVNPLSVARWATDKHYLADLAAQGVPVIPSHFVSPGMTPLTALKSYLTAETNVDEFVVKPTVGSRSKDVRRFTREQVSEAAEHITMVLNDEVGVILQPYLPSVDREGETDLTFFDRVYSHAIRKSALLMEDGTVNGPSPEFRAARQADPDEREVALAALDAAATHLCLDRPLLYGRVDLIRDEAGKPRVLELDICEPSLSLPFIEEGAMRFAHVLAALTGCSKKITR